MTDKESAQYYMKALMEVARESFLILDHDLRVILANPTFYNNFQVTKEQTENILLYDLGNRQWNIPTLKTLLEDILPEKKDIRDFEVTHTFQIIGKKTIILNARQIGPSQLIILAMEDITKRKEIEEKLAIYTKGLEVKGVEQTEKLLHQIKELEEMNKSMVGRELKMVELKKEIDELKKKLI